MHTSYFSKYKGNSGISIALSSPKNYKGECYSDLFPTWSILSQYKRDHDKFKYISEYYKQVLNKLDPFKVYDDLKDKTILCYEKSGKFCHRRIVADWIERNVGVKVEEL